MSEFLLCVLSFFVSMGETILDLALIIKVAKTANYQCYMILNAISRNVIGVRQAIQFCCSCLTLDWEEDAALEANAEEDAALEADAAPFCFPSLSK